MGKVALICFVACALFSYVLTECLDSEGKVHAVGTGSYIGTDHCNTCFCTGDFSACTKMFCAPGHSRCMAEDGTIHEEGVNFKSSDGCNTCGCTEQGIVCTEMACVQLQTELP